MDGVDAALVSLDERSCNVLSAITVPYHPDLQRALHDASRNPAACGLDTLGRLDHWVGESFRDAASQLLRDANVAPQDVVAIGSHGQTLRHQPRVARPFSMQIGDPNIIAAGTGIATVADFRRMDMAAGGEGAPLAPAFHHWLFADADRNRVVLNVGGFSNITVLRADQTDVFGFDTGPGNTLMDAWCKRHLGQDFDADGRWASSGTVDSILLQQMLNDEFFASPPPKSTGFEYFNEEWLQRQLAPAGDITHVDVQATLCELTAQSIANAIAKHAPGTDEVLLCGGGARNAHLVARMRNAFAPAALKSTAEFGIAPDWIEAAAFAWLAACRLANQPGNLPSVTGAHEAVVLGGIYAASD